MRRSVLVAAVLLLLVLGVPAAQGGAGRQQVVLGKKELTPGGVGWGTAHPRLIDDNGDPNGRAWNLRWRHWGSRVASARGRTWIFSPHGGYYAKPGVVELRAYRIGRCGLGGPRAYTRLKVREAIRPGGPLSRWIHWGGWKSICTFPT